MPALAPVAKVIRWDLLFNFGGETGIRDRFFSAYTGTLSLADLTTLAATLATAWGTNMAPKLSSAMSLVGVTATDLTSATAPQVVTTPAVVGTGTASAIGSAQAMVLKFKTARRYRGGHPRLYLTGLPSAAAASVNTWVAATATSTAQAWVNFHNSLATAPPAAVGTLSQVNVSYFQGFTNLTPAGGRFKSRPTPRGTPVTDTIIAVTANQIIASQRRRNRQSP
jgi:hypothetical protein